MKKFILIISLALSGCYQSVDSSDIDYATRICEKRNAKVMYITSYFIGIEEVICSDRSRNTITGSGS